MDRGQLLAYVEALGADVEAQRGADPGKIVDDAYR